ncbi:hypothetical protein WME78_17410 [Sorangium sp. So ce1097]
MNDETRRLVTAAYLGARHCWETYRKKKPEELTFKVTWIGFWFNIPADALAAGVGVLHQEPLDFPPLTALESFLVARPRPAERRDGEAQRSARGR